ncbi:N-acetylmuramidase domain-containing protein [Undibacterium sp. TJN25]|uniref:N-acetylmuramidase domain-containing protein n=1 Tax=Undibacterium sp. TJN25 TaxID=3413056 RepID=UPI003BF3836C
MAFQGKAVPLDKSAVNDVITPLGIEEASLWAIIEVETSGVGFMASKQPIILFERHKFSQKTAGKWDSTYPDISNPVWGGYGPAGQHQYDRLAQAIKLNESAALESASWGLGQVMGENWSSLGYASVAAFVSEMCESEGRQLHAMALFISHKGLAAKLKQKSWAEFALGYNGAGYAKNSYDTKLDQHYQKLAAGPLPDLRIRTAQLALTYLSSERPRLDPHGVDGWLGRMSQSALQEFQKGVPLAPNGVLDDATYSALLAAAGLK